MPPLLSGHDSGESANVQHDEGSTSRDRLSHRELGFRPTAASIVQQQDPLICTDYGLDLRLIGSLLRCTIAQSS